MYKYPSPNLALYRSLIAAYHRCIANKPQIKKTRFHVMHERVIHQLALDIQNRTYHPGMSNIFVVTKPKYREVIAAHLRDRVVHHLIYGYMAPYWERRFVHHSYACRPGKGPLTAVRDLERFVRGYYRRSTWPLHYLKVDVQSFFPSIDHGVLWSILDRHLENPLYRYLCKTTLDHRPMADGCYRLTSPVEMWRHLPPHKSLFHAPPGKGLAIGNLTSQFFANIYMNEMDQYVAHRCKGRHLYWQRYVDDVVFLSDRPQDLCDLVPDIQAFLQDRLKMTLNPKKTQIMPLSKGLDHLGYMIKPDHKLVRQRVVRQCHETVRGWKENPPAGPEALCSTINSYLGHFAQASSKQLRLSTIRSLQSIPDVGARIAADPSLRRICLVKDAEVDERKQREEKALRGQFCERFVHHWPGDGGLVRQKRVFFYLKKWAKIRDFIKQA